MRIGGHGFERGGVGYIVVQAGGRGSRLKQFTANKPKAIVSIDGLPIIFHLFRRFPEARFVVIGDYKKDVLDNYLEAFGDVDLLTVGADGHTGTCSGIRNALGIVPERTRFMLVWCDLVLGDVRIPESGNLVGLSGTFQCRWKYEDGVFSEEPSVEHGVAGVFVFDDKSLLEGMPDDGEFVRWLSESGIRMDPFRLDGLSEYGLAHLIDVPESGKCRPFNRMTRVDGLLVKEPVDEQGRRLAVRERAWYEHVSRYDVPVPVIRSFEPLAMEKVDGRNPFEYSFDRETRAGVLKGIMDGLKSLHEHDPAPTDRFSMYEAYYTKTMGRLAKVRDLVPFAGDPVISINGRMCRNVFFRLDELRDAVKHLTCDRFCLIHGDCTFSNMILERGERPVLIDPRGYFGTTEIVGDPNYDWAKLYYSVVGNYDKFNLGRFTLDIGDGGVTLDIESNGWEDVEDIFEENLPEGVSMKEIRLIHAIIWLSLTTYAWNDYDSICGAFYNGLYYLEESL